MGKTEKNKNGKGEDEILGRDIPTVETAQSEKQKLVVEIDQLASNIAGEKKKLVEHGQEAFAQYEELFGEFENKIAVLQKELADLQVTEKVQGVMIKIGRFRKKIKNLIDQAGDIIIAVSDATKKSEPVADKIEESPVAEPVEPLLPAVDTEPEPSASEKKEPKEKTPEMFTLTKEGVVRLGDRTIDLSSLMAGGQYDVTINENGTVKVSGKDDPDTYVRFQFDTENNSIAFQQVRGKWQSKVALLEFGQVIEKVISSFPEKGEQKRGLSFEGGILKTPNFSLDLNSLLDGGKCGFEMKNGVLYINGKDDLVDMQAKLELSGDKKHIALKIRKKEEVVWDYEYLPDFAKTRLESTFIKKAVKKTEPVVDKKTAAEPAKKTEPVVAAEDSKERAVSDKNGESAENFSQDKLQQLVELLEETGNEEMTNWASSLRVGLPESGNESDELKGKRKLYEKKLFGPEDDMVKSTLNRVVKYFKQQFSDSSLERTAAFREAIGDKQNIDSYLRIVDLLGVKKEKGFSPEIEARHAKLKTAADNLYTQAKQLLFDINNIRIDKSGKVVTEHPPYVGKDEIQEKSKIKITDRDKTELKQYDDLKNSVDILAYDILLICGAIDQVTDDDIFVQVEQDAEKKIALYKIALDEYTKKLDEQKLAEKKFVAPDASADMGVEIPVELGTPEETTAGTETPEQKIQNTRDRFLDETSEKYLGFKDEIAAYKILHPEAVKDGDEQLEVIRVKVAGAVADSKSISDPEALKTYFDGQNAEIDEYLKDFRRKRREIYFGGMEPIEAAGETGERTYAPETVSENPPEASAEDLLERFDQAKAAEVQRRNEILRDLHSKLAVARENLANAFAEKEKAGGFVGSFKKMFGSKERELSESRFNFAWNEYSGLQQELLEASEKQAEELAEFLQQESSALQSKLGEYYKGKENIVSKAWRKLGDLNLHNFLEKKGSEAKQKTEQGEALGRWDSFWANRADEYSKSHTLYKLGAKAISARTVISLGLMGGGILGFTGAAEARGAFVGIGATVGSRQIQDAVQNKMQKWLGNRGEFYGTRSQAEEALRAKYGIIEKHYDEGVAVDEPEDKKTARRRAKFEKELAAVTEKISKKDKLSVAEQLAKVQEKIAAIEAYAYVNGLDLSKDKNYVRLAEERNVLTNLFLNEQAEAAGDMRVVIRPENLDDAREFLASRKAELEKTAQKISAEKRLRWGKRIISVAIGATAGTFAYFATLSRAAAFGHGPKEAAVGAVAGKTTEYGAIPSSHDTTPLPGSQTPVEAPSASMGEQAIPDKFLVHKGDGLERVLQRQLLADPQKFGYTEQMGDVKHWAGHEASVIAQKQGIADKYFIYNEKNPQYLVLNDDRTVTTIGRLHDEAEIVASKARAAAEVGQEHVEKPVPVREVIDTKTGQPKFMTDLEKAQVDKLWDEGKLGDAMQVMMDSKAEGPIIELSDGTFVHQADIAGTAITTETLPAPDVVTTGAAGALSPVEHVPVPKEGIPGTEHAKPADFDELVKGGEMKPLGSFDSRYGHQVFVYENGKAVAFEANFDENTTPTVDEAAEQVFKAPPAADTEISMGTASEIRIAAVYENIYRDLAAKGFQNSTEAQMIKERIADNARDLAEDLSKKPGELFKDDYLRTFGMKDEIAGAAGNADEEAARWLRGE